MAMRSATGRTTAWRPPNPSQYDCDGNGIGEACDDPGCGVCRLYGDHVTAFCVIDVGERALLPGRLF